MSDESVPNELGDPTSYQVMPSMTAEEFAGLKESIRTHGLLVPIEYDDRGAVIDGNHRLEALRQLGREKHHSRVIRSGLTEDEKVAHALALNVYRRHLTSEQRAEAVHKLRRAGWSVRRIADKAGISKTTVVRDLAKSSFDDSPMPETVMGADGKVYKARRSTKPTTVYVHSEHQHRVAEAALQVLDGEVPSKTVDLRRLERLRRSKQFRERREAQRDPFPVVDGVDIRLSDVRDLVIADASVDLLLTDPPYLQAHFDADGPWDVLGRQATRWLKPGGMMLAFCGQSHLARAVQTLSKYEADGLSYWWTFAILFQPGNARQVRTRNVASSWRAVLAFRMDGGTTLPGFAADPILGSGKEKGEHEWQQGLHEARVLIDRLCPPSESSLVVDCFAGSGTIPLAAVLENRRVIAADIDPDCVRTTSRRIREAMSG